MFRLKAGIPDFSNNDVLGKEMLIVPKGTYLFTLLLSTSVIKKILRILMFDY